MDLMKINMKDQQRLEQLNLPAYETSKGTNIKFINTDKIRRTLFLGKWALFCGNFQYENQY